jgi:DegV family protein with EDD domain
MNNITIIADSTCDLDPFLTQDTYLEILPLRITINDKSYLDGEEIKVSDVYRIMRKGIVPQTAQIPYNRIYDLFKSVFERGDDFIYIAFSSKMSSCYTLACMVAEELCGEYPERKYAIIDSRGGSSATGLIVLQALRMVRKGLPFETVESEIKFMAGHVEHVFSVDDLGWLAKGGRIPKTMGYVGSKLKVHPILEVENGRMIVRGMVLGHKKSIRVVADEIIRRAEKFPTQLMAITHADDLPSARLLEQYIKEGLPNCRTTLCQIGAALGVHIGLKGIGAFCLNQMPPHYSFQ